MHSKEHQEFLNSLTDKQKIDRTKLKSMQKRGVVVKVYEYWFITKNEFPHIDRGQEQYILRERHNSIQSRYNQEKRHEFYRIIEDRKDYFILRNPIRDATVKGRLHFHIYK